MPAKHHTKCLRLLASTSLLGLAIAATPLTLSIDWQDAGISLQTAEARSCFTPETLVLMADGSETRICDIRVGDRVMSGEGRINSVVAVERPRLNGRKLHAFNGGEFFVTAEHPFLTPAGWKAIDPRATAEENPALTVASLVVGDLLTVAVPAGDATQGNLALALALATRLLPLERIDSIEADPNLRVYNLLLDGDHSYIANGFVVHNKGGDDGDSGGGESGGGESGNSGRGGGDDDGDDDHGEHGEAGDDHGEHGEAGDDHGEHGEDGDDHGEHGESGEHAEDDDDGEHHRRGGDVFGGEAGSEDASISGAAETTIIGNGWK